MFHVYRGDMMVTACSSEAASQAIKAAVVALRSAGFIVSPKFELTPTTQITFLGKRVDSVLCSITNTRAMLVPSCGCGSGPWAPGRPACV